MASLQTIKHTASQSPIVLEILEILEKEVPNKIQLLTAEELKALSFDLYENTDFSTSFALLFPEQEAIPIINCLSTFPEIELNKSENTFLEQKFRIAIYSLISRTQHLSFLGKLIKVKNVSLSLKEKRVLRSLENISYPPTIIAQKTNLEKQEVSNILEKLRKIQLIELKEDIIILTSKGKKALNQFRG